MRVSHRFFTVGLALFLIGFGRMSFAQNKQLTYEDIMRFEDISNPVNSENGAWIAYSVWPDRGDGRVQIRSIDSTTSYAIERGDDPTITPDGRWVGAIIKPPLMEQLKADKKHKPLPGASFLNTGTGRVIHFDSVKTYSFSNDANWVAVQHGETENKEEGESRNSYDGKELILKSLEDSSSYSIPSVSEFAFDSTSSFLAYAVVDTTTGTNGLYYRSLSNPDSVHQIMASVDGLYANLTWNEKNRRLAFTAAPLDSTDTPGPASLNVWSPEAGLQQLLDDADANKGWTLRTNNHLHWTTDGKRLFFGFMPEEMVDLNKPEATDSTEKVAVYDRREILDRAGLDVWHWNDPRIKPHEKKTWQERKNKLYKAVYHLQSDEWVQLADRGVPDVEFTNSPWYALGHSNIPYLKEMTWNGFFDDYYLVNLRTGKRKMVAQKLRSRAEISPSGKYILFFEDKNWHLYDAENDFYRNLTTRLDTPFYNEDHDYPYPAPGYGIGGWVRGEDAVLIYDKYDIWQFPTNGRKPTRITERTGRRQERIFRIVDLEPHSPYFDRKERLLLKSYHDKKKNDGFYTARVGKQGIEWHYEVDKKFEVIAKPRNSDKILYTRESYTEYPNLWISSGIEFKIRKRISRLHLDVTEKYDWGTAELVEWNSLDGTPMQGVLIKPGNYQEGKRYPLLVYYYRFFSQRLYEFNVPRNNHRPVFAQYASDGYAIFLPDIRFEVGTPGFSATKSLVPGVQELVDRGIADPNGLGLHGHSWSGYQTAFMITQTDIFDAAVAGAPVSNMTSAYGGIRWESGLARQFQYEKTQSRIGGSLWEYPERYIENSPLFYADRIHTPLLIEFGDKDGAVPWYQGIELYLAMRRLGKEAVFLQYHGEPHHLQQYPNKLDYAIRMKQYFDHYLKGEPAPEWITKGVPYRGEDR